MRKGFAGRFDPGYTLRVGRREVEVLVRALWWRLRSRRGIAAYITLWMLGFQVSFADHLPGWFITKTRSIECGSAEY